MEAVSLIEQEIIKNQKEIKELEKDADLYEDRISYLKDMNNRHIKSAKRLGIKFYKINQKKKKPTYKQLAKYLGVTEQAVKQYPKLKRDLMIAGLGKSFETECNITLDEKQIIANTLFEFVEQNHQDITRAKEIDKIRSIYKKLYKDINL